MSARPAIYILNQFIKYLCKLSTLRVVNDILYQHTSSNHKYAITLTIHW